LLSSLAGCDSCKKDEEPKEKPTIPAAQGQATEDIVATGIGNGMGMRPARPPSSTKWDHVFVLDGQRAILTGRALDNTYAVMTDDRGQSWKKLTAEAPQFAAWGTDSDGHLALVTGATAKGNFPEGTPRPVESATIQFLTTVGDLTEPGPFFGPDVEAAKGLSLPSGLGWPAVLRQELASMVLSEGRSAKLSYTVPAGAERPATKDLPAGNWVTAPYAQPPQLMAVRGNQLAVYPWPQPDQDLSTTPRMVPGVTGGAAAAEGLSRGAHCDQGKWSFHRLTRGNSATLVGISDTEHHVFPLPPDTGDGLGCTSDAISVEVTDTKTKEPQVARCTLDGKCAVPESPPFEIWEDEHEREIASTPTPMGAVAIMAATAGDRWGVYLAVSNDSMKTFNLPRAIGEGQGGRGRFEIGALFTMGDRIVLVLSAEVTGSNRRGFYTLVSDDGGMHFGPP